MRSPSRSRARSTGSSTTSTPTGPSARPASRSSPASRAALPASTPTYSGMEPRQLEMPARQLRRPYHGAYRWWVRADEPMSHRIGSWPRMTSAQRKNLSRAQFPMWVAVA